MTTMSGETLHRKELLEEPHRHIGTYRYSGQWSVGYDKYLSKSRLFHTHTPLYAMHWKRGGGNDELKRKWDVYIFDIERTQLNTVNSKGVFAKRN